MTKSQRTKIKNALERGDRLTRLACLRRFGCLEAGARITELRQAGMDIVTEMKMRNGSGEGTS